MQLSYLDFELEIGIGQGRDFPVVAHSPAGEARTMMRLPYDELALENRLKDLQIALLRSGGQRRQVLSPEQQVVRSFGQALFDALFTGEVRSRFDVSLQQARSQGKGLRIRLQAQSPAVAALPWEYLYDPRRAEYCALSLETPVVRYIELSQPLAPLAVAPPLRILAMVPSPSDLAALDVAQEKQRIEQALQGLRAQGRVDLQWLPGQTWRHLQEALRRGPWHIFHFSGHGRFDALTDEGQLIFADDRGRARAMPASDVGRLLANHRSLRLVWLNACEGARGGEADIFSSTASILVRRGIPAVVAMQHEITDRAAIELARTFYGALADGYPVDAALAEARVATSVAVNNTVEWGTPVLYMRAPDGVLFDLATPDKAAAESIGSQAVADTVGNPVVGPMLQESKKPAPTWASTQPAVRPAPVGVQGPKQRSLGGLGRVVLTIALLALAIGAIVLIAYRAALFPGRAETQAAETTFARAETAGVTLSGANTTTTLTPTTPGIGNPTIAASELPTQTIQASKLVVTKNGATVMKPVRMELVRVPAGEFLMGSDPTGDSGVFSDEEPQHRLTLAEFYIGKYEVTNEQYAAFVEATGYDAPDHWRNGSIPSGEDEHPVTNVTWSDAVAFTEWLKKEAEMPFRLPTEAEWEKSCRGPDGMIYPWGDEFHASRANTREASVGTPVSVGKYSPDDESPYGAADMAGNVWEWTSSLYTDYPYNPTDGREDMGGSDMRVLRGGSVFNLARYVRCAVRGWETPDYRSKYFGFRVVVVFP